MKILIYLGHPAQFHFFKNSIRQLKENGNDIFILIKSKDVLEKLLLEEKFDYFNIQKKTRKNSTTTILIASIQRTIQVVKFSLKNNIDLLLGTDSSIAQAAFLLRKKSITTLEDDYKVIKKLCNLTYPFTNTILVPSVCDVGRWENKKIGYQGYMKLAYLHPIRFTPDINIKKKYVDAEKYILIRVAKLNAYHDVGIKGLNRNTLLKIIELGETLGYKVFINSETKLENEFEKYLLPINPSHVHHILSYASLFISDSQSMSVEASMLGVPSVRFSDFSGEISVLEELEHTYGLTYGVKTNSQEIFFEKIKNILLTSGLNEIYKDKQEKLLRDKIDVASFLTWFIENYPESSKIMKQNPNYQFNFK